MERKKPDRRSQSGLRKESGPWRPTKRQVLWAIAMIVAVATIALLVVQLYPAMWEDLSQKRVATLIGMAVALTIIVVLLALGGASLGWTGFGDKKLWDWLQLLSALAIPILLTVAGFWFAAQQDEREAKRIENERNLEEQRTQDAALQAYLDQMSQLMLERNLRDSDEDSEVRTLSRARTLTVVRKLDSERRRILLQFLYEANLIDKKSPVVDLAGAGFAETDLSGMTLNNASLAEVNLAKGNLIGAWLYGADLSGSRLQGTKLERAYLQHADLSYVLFSAGTLKGGPPMIGPQGVADPTHTLSTGSGLQFRRFEETEPADLNRADLRGASLFGAWLGGVNLRGANLNNAKLQWALLEGVDMSPYSVGYRTKLSGASLRNGDLTGANLEYADLSDANLEEAWLDSSNLEDADLSNAEMSGANLSDANLSGAEMSGANLSLADLNDANLEDANLEDTKGFTESGLELQAKSLQGATMPNGQEYEDWLKDRERRQQDD